MTNLAKLLAASACAIALTACATSDPVLSDAQTIGINDNDNMRSSGGSNMASLDAKFKVGCDDGDQFEARGCDGLDSDGDGIDRDIYASDRERDDFYRMNGISYTPRTAVLATESIADIVGSSPMTVLAASLEATDLLGVLDDEGEQYTVFAPTNAAFERAELSRFDDEDDMRTLLLNHVLPGRFLALDFVELLGTGSTYSTAAAGGAPLSLYRSGENLRLVNGDRTLVPILTADRVASNGVIHIIDTVLVPPVN